MLLNPKDFPNLTASNHRDIISTPDPRYNCIAWAAGIDNDFWEPAEGKTWPGNAPRGLDGLKVTSLLMVFESADYKECADGSLEDGIEKIAIYADGPEWMHAARQLATGKWTSKMGPDERIEHDAPENLAGGRYGQVVKFMRRDRVKSAKV
jgi:hypothetical protein